MTSIDRAEARRRIEAILGERSSLGTFQGRMRWDRQYEQLMKLAEKEGLEILSLVLVDGHGITASGKQAVWIANTGMTERSRYCGTLIIEGKTIFTSGTLIRAFKHLAEN